MEISAYWNEVDEEIVKYDLLRHPFYQAWSAGELTSQDLRFYAEQYYHQVSNFPTYLTSLHSRLPEGAMRRDVLANAFDEECAGAGSVFTVNASSEAWSQPEYRCPHSELWLRFLEGMGGNGSESAQGAPICEVEDLVKTFRTLATEAPIATAFGALFAYESQVPKISAEKLNGLKQHYGADDRTCSYFALHRTADLHHANVWRKIISSLVEQDDRHANEVLDGVSQAARALWTALDGIERERPNHSDVCSSAAKMN